MTSTFYALLDLADLSTPVEPKKEKAVQAPVQPPATAPQKPIIEPQTLRDRPTLHYNIQIHLPATKDTEVFNAIFKALKEHLFE